jgi:PAS domain S-box-containing protein
MSPRFRSADDSLSAADRRALSELGSLLWEARGVIAREWSRRLMAHMPESFVGTDTSLEQLSGLNEVFLTVVLEQMRRGDLAGLSQTYYDMNRRLIELDLQTTGPRGRISLDSLYTSARLSLQVIGEQLGPEHEPLLLAYTRLTTHLMMLVGLAYSDCREEALQRAQDELERTVGERTAALRAEKMLADTIIETLPGMFFMIDAGERVVRWNAEMEKVSGYTAAEIGERHPLEYFDPADRPFLAGKMAEAFGAGHATAEANLIARDGTAHPRLFTSRRVEMGGQTLLVGVAIDVAERRRAAERLEKEKAFSDSIIESLPGVFYLFNAEGRFLRWNRNFAEVTQYGDDEIAGMHPTEFFRGQDKLHIADRIGAVLTEGEATAQADFVAKDGSKRPYFFTGKQVVVDEHVCVIGMGIDITERKQAEEALQRARTAQLFAALLEAAPDAVLVSDHSGAIVFANSESERLFGEPRAALLGQQVSRLIPGHPGRPLAAGVEAWASSRDGRRLPIEIKLSPLETDDGVLLTSAIRDITDRRRAEEEIRSLNVDLERRVAERTRELERSNADLEQFAYVASHDLQEPLRAVASYTQLLARRYRNRLDGDALRFVDRTTAAVARMQALIRDLLAYSRVGTRGERFGTTDTEAVLREALDDLQASIAEAGALVTHDPLPKLPADALQLRQLFQNLIGNAIKFRRDEPPRVHVSARRDGGNWLFSVRDNGIGIEPEYAERIFVIFQRLHSRTAYPGTGVGLAICKRIVERHGGHIWVESDPGAGTSIHLRLPAQEAMEPAARAVIA